MRQTAAQHENRKFIENILTNDAVLLEKYYNDWQLCPNPEKTKVTLLLTMSKYFNFTSIFWLKQVSYILLYTPNNLQLTNCSIFK